MRVFTTMILLCGCGPASVDEISGACDDPLVFYPDDNGDGVGETHSAYFGCNAPPGWVTNLTPNPTVPTTGTGGTGDTGTPTDTSDTGTP